MDQHINEFYTEFQDGSARGNFHRVIPLHDSPSMTWETVVKKVPRLCKGWFELARLKSSDRIEFTSDYWEKKLPYHSSMSPFLNRFFNSLDDIGIYMIQKTYESPFEANLVYSIAHNGGFFRGNIGASEEDIAKLRNVFPKVILPEDYIAFLQIHDGFCKTTDSTGIINSKEMANKCQTFQKLLDERGPLIGKGEKVIDPETLIPFYESFGMPFFQCFWSEWYPQQEMGNVYYSGTSHMISDIERKDLPAESMAFPTFLDWLVFYMERIE